MTTVPTLEEVGRAMVKSSGDGPVPLAWIVDDTEALRTIFECWARDGLSPERRYVLLKSAFCLGMGLGLEIGVARGRGSAS